MSATNVIPFPRPTSLTKPSARWIGGIVRVRGFHRDGKPLRVAAWITRSGDVLDAVIVEGHGPSVLRELFCELLARAGAHRGPAEVVVWPSARAAFRDLQYPEIRVERDLFLSVVIEDQADAGFIPGRLAVRRGRSTSANSIR